MTYTGGIKTAQELMHEEIYGAKLPKQYPLIKTPTILTAEDIGKYGAEVDIRLRELGGPGEETYGWMLKATPTEEGYDLAYIAPGGVPIAPGEIYVAPDTGKWMTAEEARIWEEEQKRILEEARAEWERGPLYKTGMAAPYQVPGYIEPTEPLYRGGPAVPQQLESYRFKEAVGMVFPPEEVNEIVNWLAEDKPERDEAGMTHWPRMDEFSELIWRVGRNPETEALLGAMGASNEEVEEFFSYTPGVVEPVEAEIPVEKPTWQKVLDWALSPFTATGTMFAQMWSPHKPVRLTPAGFEYEPFDVAQFDVGYGKFAHEEQANIALESYMQNIKEMGIPESQWDIFLVGAKTFFDYTIANNMARMPGGVITEDYERLPWWKQMIAEAPLWIALAGVPGAQAVRARMAARAARGGLVGRAAQFGRVAITPAAQIERGLGYPFRKLAQRIAERKVVEYLAKQGITLGPGARKQAIRALSINLDTMRAGWKDEALRWATHKNVKFMADNTQKIETLIRELAKAPNQGVRDQIAIQIMNIMDDVGRLIVTPNLTHRGALHHWHNRMLELVRFAAKSYEMQTATAAITQAQEIQAKFFLEQLETLMPTIMAGLGVSAAKAVVKGVEAGPLMELPPQQGIINAALQPNWQKSLLQFIGKMPGGERFIRWVDSRELINRDAKTITDIVNQNIIGWQEVIRIGQSAKAIKLGELQAITTEPVKMFGFNKNAYSTMMANRLDPEYEGTLEAGTLEHVFTRPLMYNWEGFEKGLNYVSAVQRINKEALSLLKAEGVAPEGVTEDWWIHRVVEGKYDPNGELIAVRGRPGMKRRLAVTKAYEMHRKAPTMYEGMTWKIKYAENPELSITTYLDEVFSKIAGERFFTGTDEALGAIGKAGKSPLEVLAEKYPDIAKRAEITVRERGYAEKALGVIKNVLRGYQPSAQTLKAIEGHFPELGKRLRTLTTKQVETKKDLREVLKNNKRSIENLQKIVEKQKEAIEKGKITKAEAIAQARKQIEVARAESLKVIPDEVKLREAFRLMHYEDRLAFRDTITNQQAEIEQMLYEQEGQLQGLQEFLRTDPIAVYRGRVGKRVVSLTSILRQGQIPETVTPKMARLLLMGAEPKIIKEGRVPREYVMDELADHFGISESELEDALVNIYEVKQTIEDLKMLIRIAKDRVDSIKQMLRILDGVEHPENIPIPEQEPIVQPEVMPEIPKAVTGMPEAGLQADIFGHATPVTPPGKGEVTQISMEDYEKLVEHWRKAGIPEQDMPIAIRPQVEGIPGLEKEVEIKQVSLDVPEEMTKAERLAELRVLKAEVEAILSGKKVAFYRARLARAGKIEEIKQPPIGEGFLIQSRFAGKIYDQEFIDLVNKFFGHKEGSKSLKFIADIAGILRITKASLDFSFMAIQGMPAFGLASSYMMTNPKIGMKMMASWFKGLFYPVKGAFQPEWLHAYLAKNNEEALQRVSFGGSSQAVDYFEALRTGGGLAGLAARGMAKIPLKPYHRAELVFYGAGEIVRNEFWKVLKDEAIKTGNEYNLARFLDRMTGIISTESMGVPISMRQLESAWVWFAPRYTRACLTLIAHTFRGGFTGAKARRALGAMVAAGVAMYAGIQYAIAKLEGKDDEEAWDSVLEGFCVYHDPITDTYEWRPSAKFMTFQIGNYNMGIGGFWYGLLRLAGNIMATINRQGDRELIDFVRIIKDGKLNRDNPLIYWWYTRASPFLGFMLEAGGSLLKSITSLELNAGSDFLGYPIETPWDYAHYILTRFEPIWAEQGLNWMVKGMAREQEIPEGIVRFLLPAVEMFGLRTFPISSWVEFYDEAQEIINRIPLDLLRKYYTEDELSKILDAQGQGKLRWEHLPEALQTELLEMYPELQELRENALEDSSIRGSDDWKQWQDATDKIKTEYYERGDNIVDRLQKSEIDTREFREYWGEAGQNYGIALDTIQDQEFYKVIYDYFEKKRQEDKRYDWNLDAALLDYQAVVFTEYLDDKGDIDWDARDEAIDNFIQKWGEDVYLLIREMYTRKKLMEGLSPILLRLADDKEKLGREYWRLPHKPIYKMDLEDETLGNIPTEYYALWKEYQALETDAEREAFLEKYTDIAKDWRGDYRKSHPEEDAILAMWGYGGKLQSLEAYNLVEKWSQELGIPMSQMGLGLPPRNLTGNYFEHNEIVAETSGNSIESKLYLLTEGGKYLGWLLGQGIRKDDLSDESVRVLQLRVDFKDEFAKYDDYGNVESEHYIIDAGDLANKRQRMKFTEEGKLTDFGKAYYTKQAYEMGYPERIWEDHLGFREQPEYGDYQERFLLANPAYAAFHYSPEYGEGHPRVDFRDINELARDELYGKFKTQYDSWGDVGNLSDFQIETMRNKLLEEEVDGMTFAEARRRIDAYDADIDEEYHDDYVAWYLDIEGKPDKERDTFEGMWFEDDWFLMEHSEFYRMMLDMGLWTEEKDFSKVPTKEVWELYQIYKQEVLEGQPRLDYRAKHPELDAWLVTAKNYTPVADRGKPSEEKTAAEEFAEEMAEIKRRLRLLQ